MTTTSKTKVGLKIDWATHEAARYACENWHYSKCLPQSKTVKVGVWERSKFVGVVIFSQGAAPGLLKPYGLRQEEGCELTRIALSDHVTPVTRIVSIAFKFLKSQSPGLRLVVSFADPSEGHHGGIYQGGNWIYTGLTKPERFGSVAGKVLHPRTLLHKYGTRSFSDLKARGVKEVIKPGKHRYLMPLDQGIRDRVSPLSKPYPKRDI